MSERGVLVVCGTPIGNLGDVSERLGETLRVVDAVYAEDTRRTAILLRHVDARPPLRSLFVGNESIRTGELLGLLAEGKTVALVTDAGMPTVSDPGAEAVRRARAAGYRVTAIPGPSAVTTALALSGFVADRFVFEGFLPKKGRERTARLAALAEEERPVVVFASPHRLTADLTDISTAAGPERQIAITRELTKLHEEVWVGEVGRAVEEWAGRDVKGELTLVVGPGAQAEVSVEEAVAEARSLVESGIAPSEAARRAAKATGASRRQVYQSLIGDQERS